MTANWKNRTLFHGDNLKFLRAMNSESVDLIATDPPFNKGRDFHATPDSLSAGAKFQDRWRWEQDVQPDWLDTIKDDWPAAWEVIDAANAVYMRQTKKNLLRPRDEVGSDMGAFLCFMAVRIMEMRRVLKPTGSIYLHCDPTASHYLKALMDAIFGKRNLRNEIVWCYRKWSVKAGQFVSNHDVILFYSKGKDSRFNVQFVPPSQGTQKRWKGKRQRAVFVDGVRQARSTDDPARSPMPDWWEISILNPNARERVGFPTQKPLELYERIIRASSDEGDIVLDPFAGCATTCVAAERLGRRWVGIDIWDKAHETVLNRLKEEGLSGPDRIAEGLLHFGAIHYLTEPPKRTDDDGGTAAPFLRVKVKVKEPSGPRWTRAKMYEHLLEQHGPRCQGCDRTFDDSRYLELDHNRPRSDGGPNHVTNRILLCGPCNRLKSNIYTLSGLRRENAKRGYMAGSGGDPTLKEIRENRARNPGLFD